MRNDGFVLETVARSRSVSGVYPATPATDGAGVKLARNLGPELHRRLDPFLLLDEFHADDAADYIAGFPDHPHRGFETVTYMLAGSMEHRDSEGNHGLLRAGSVQWMKAARGVIHSEMPRQEQGLMRGFQLWVNLAAAEKMDAPSYQDIEPESIPYYEPAPGVFVKVIAGDSHGVLGVAEPRNTQPLYVDIRLDADWEFEHPIPAAHHALIYVYEGQAEIGPIGAPRPVAASHLAELGPRDDADGVHLRASGGEARLLLIAGRPLRENIVQYGPFVMNSKQEIEQAFEDYRRGRLTR